MYIHCVYMRGHFNQFTSFKFLTDFVFFFVLFYHRIHSRTTVRALLFSRSNHFKQIFFSFTFLRNVFLLMVDVLFSVGKKKMFFVVCLSRRCLFIYSFLVYSNKKKYLNSGFPFANAMATTIIMYNMICLHSTLFLCK